MQLGKLAALVAGPPLVERYEVAVRSYHSSMACVAYMYKLVMQKQNHQVYQYFDPLVLRRHRHIESDRPFRGAAGPGRAARRSDRYCDAIAGNS